MRCLPNPHPGHYGHPTAGGLSADGKADFAIDDDTTPLIFMLSNGDRAKLARLGPLSELSAALREDLSGDLVGAVSAW